jgi:Transposase DDE domain./Transposase domain (DUF772).
MKDISLFTSQPKAHFYDKLFLHLDLTAINILHARTGRKSEKEALLCSFIVMKCEGFSQITDLVDYLNNNLIIAHYCGFDIMKKLPSYWTFDRFIRNIDNAVLKELMKSQVLKLSELGIIDTSFIGLDSTPVHANTSHNNPKSFKSSRFSNKNHPKADKDCGLGVHTASNQHNEKNYEFYWGYKNHVLADCITGLPIFELTTTADVADSTVALDILSRTNEFLSVQECCFIADKGYDVNKIYDEIKTLYEGECFIPINQRGTKDLKKLPVGNPICEAGFAMHRDGTFSEKGYTRQKFCCPFKRSSHLHDCPCSHKNFKKGSKATGCTKYYPLSDNYRLSIIRDSIKFKSVYSLRTECERYNSRFKSTGQDRLWVRNAESAQNLNSIAHISLLAVALAAVVTHSKISYRAIKSLKRIA